MHQTRRLMVVVFWDTVLLGGLLLSKVEGVGSR